MVEIWKAIPGYEGRYEVSSHGNVRSLDRVLPDGRLRRGMPLKAIENVTYGYKSVQLGRGNRHKIATLVALAFIGPRPPEHEVCHNDGVRIHDHVENLRYDTRAGNFADMVEHGTRISGENHKGSRLKQVDVQTIRESYASGRTTYRELGEQYGVGYATIRDVVKGYTWVGG